MLLEDLLYLPQNRLFCPKKGGKDVQPIANTVPSLTLRAFMGFGVIREGLPMDCVHAKHGILPFSLGRPPSAGAYTGLQPWRCGALCNP